MRTEKEIFEIQKRLNDRTTQYRLDCRNVLTPEQQAKLASFGRGMERGYGRIWKYRATW